MTELPEPIRVGVLGARGRMGQEVCKAVDAASDLELVAMVDAGDWLFSVADAGAQVLVDFTHPDVVMDPPRLDRQACLGKSDLESEHMAIN